MKGPYHFSHSASGFTVNDKNTHLLKIENVCIHRVFF